MYRQKSSKAEKNESSNEKHIHRSRFQPAMPQTLFPGHYCANGLLKTPFHIIVQTLTSAPKGSIRVWKGHKTVCVPTTTGLIRVPASRTSAVMEYALGAFLLVKLEQVALVCL